MQTPRLTLILGPFSKAFVGSLPDPWLANAIRSDELHSLIGAALLHTGWTEDLAVLKQPGLVLKA